MNTQVASATEQQSSTTPVINGKIANIQSIAEQTAVGAGKISGSSDELNRLSEQLRVLVGQFTV